jgi:dTDP-6-deoxy-L-talose 4-dehydrogenase (NAD+)
MAKGAAAAGVRRFVGIGTCSEYDSNAEEFHSSTPLRPVTVYAATKAATYLSLSQWLPNMGTEFLWCRLFYLFGDGEDERRLVGYIRSRLSKGQSVELTNGLQVRDFLDVRIAADMIVKAALGQKQGAANICSGVPITIRELAMRVADEYGMRDKLIFGARPDNLFDPPKIVGKVESLNTP